MENNKKQSRLLKQGRSTKSALIGSYSLTIPDVVGKTRLEAINTFFNYGIDYLLSYTTQGATAQNNDIVALQANDGISTITVYKYVAPQLPVNISISFTSGEDPDYVQAPYEPYNPYPNSGIVIGSGPQTLSANVGASIILPSPGSYQMVERRANFVNSGGSFNRQIPDELVYPPFVGWTDGQLIYTAGSSYVIPQPNSGQSIELKAVWRTEVYTPTFSSFSPTSGSVGSTVLLNGKKLASIERVYFRNNILSDFTVINDNLIQAIVPQGSITGRITIYTYSGSLSLRPTNFTVI